MSIQQHLLLLYPKLPFILYPLYSSIIPNTVGQKKFLLEMSYCSNLTRNGDNHCSVGYLTQTSNILKRTLQCWISSVLAAGWMPIDPITESLDDGALFYPLGLITCNLKGNFHSKNSP